MSVWMYMGCMDVMTIRERVHGVKQCMQIDEGVSLVLKAIKKAIVC